MMYEEYVDRQGEVVTGIVQQAGDRNNVLVDLGKVEALLPRSEQVDGERYEQGSRIKAVITEVRSGTKGPQVILSRRDPELIKTLFELEVPEIADGLVEIRGVAREPGYRSKIAVESHAQGVDPVGACVGPRGSRVRMVVSELRGEKIDIIPWNTEPARFVAKALSPARVREVYIDDETKEATVVVPNDQLALAIGKEGLNARLAARLTGWKVDIQSDRSSRRPRPRRRSPATGDGEEATTPAAAPRSSRTASAARTRRCPARATAACRPTRRWSAPSPRQASRPPRSRSRRRLPRPSRRSLSPRWPRSRSTTSSRGDRPRSKSSPRSRGAGCRRDCCRRDEPPTESEEDETCRVTVPDRTCAGCGRKAPQPELVRFAARAGTPGRGSHGARPRRLHLPAARLLRARGGPARVQPRPEADRRRRSGARAPLH